MWLTRVLWGHRFRSHKIPGRHFLGKHRRFRPITQSMIRNMEQRLALEEENAKYLSRPFLTKEEEFNHSNERRMKNNAEIAKVRRLLNVLPHRYMDQHLGHLRISRKWE